MLLDVTATIQMHYRICFKVLICIQDLSGANAVRARADGNAHNCLPNSNDGNHIRLDATGDAIYSISEF